MMRYDNEELKKFLLPEHKWIYFSIRVFRSNGWLYFAMGMLPILGNFCTSDQPKTLWSIFGTLCFALAGGCVSMKAWRSQSPKDDQGSVETVAAPKEGPK